MKWRQQIFELYFKIIELLVSSWLTEFNTVHGNLFWQRKQESIFFNGPGNFFSTRMLLTAWWLTEEPSQFLSSSSECWWADALIIGNKTNESHSCQKKCKQRNNLSSWFTWVNYFKVLYLTWNNENFLQDLCWL